MYQKNSCGGNDFIVTTTATKIIMILIKIRNVDSRDV